MNLRRIAGLLFSVLFGVAAIYLWALVMGFSLRLLVDVFMLGWNFIAEMPR